MDAKLVWVSLLCVTYSCVERCQTTDRKGTHATELSKFTFQLVASSRVYGAQIMIARRTHSSTIRATLDNRTQGSTTCPMKALHCIRQ